MKCTFMYLQPTATLNEDKKMKNRAAQERCRNKKLKELDELKKVNIDHFPMILSICIKFEAQGLATLSLLHAWQLAWGLAYISSKLFSLHMHCNIVITFKNVKTFAWILFLLIRKT